MQNRPLTATDPTGLVARIERRFPDESSRGAGNRFFRVTYDNSDAAVGGYGGIVGVNVNTFGSSFTGTNINVPHGLITVEDMPAPGPGSSIPGQPAQTEKGRSVSSHDMAFADETDEALGEDLAARTKDAWDAAKAGDMFAYLTASDAAMMDKQALDKRSGVTLSGYYSLAPPPPYSAKLYGDLPSDQVITPIPPSFDIPVDPKTENL